MVKHCPQRFFIWAVCFTSSVGYDLKMAPTGRHGRCDGENKMLSNHLYWTICICWSTRLKNTGTSIECTITWPQESSSTEQMAHWRVFTQFFRSENLISNQSTFWSCVPCSFLKSVPHPIPPRPPPVMWLRWTWKLERDLLVYIQKLHQVWRPKQGEIRTILYFLPFRLS